MHRTPRVGWIMLMFTLAASACVLPAIGLQDPAAINTAAAQTIIAGLTQTALAAGTRLPASETPSPTLTTTPEPPTSTFAPTATLTASLTFTPLASSTPVYPQVSVSMPTNCRSGPGKVFALMGGLMPGETAQVYGRDPTGDYWYIRNPDDPSGFCWVWGKYATLSGNTAILPIFTPPPTPKPTATSTPQPTFQATYEGLDLCNNWWLEFKLRNNGTLAFTSMSITVKDTVTGEIRTRYADDFLNRNGCSEAITHDTLGAGKSIRISSPVFGYDLSGHRILATIKLCSQQGQSGICISRSLKFTP